MVRRIFWKYVFVPFLLALLFSAISCNLPFDLESKEYEERVNITAMTPEQIAQLIILRELIRPRARKGVSGIATAAPWEAIPWVDDGNPLKHLMLNDDSLYSNVDGDHDSALWAGLLCLSGDSPTEKEQCDMVRASQNRDMIPGINLPLPGYFGRVWRSPRRRHNYREIDYSFSRDMARGIYAYVIKNRYDPEAQFLFVSWIEYIKSTQDFEAPHSTLSQVDDLIGSFWVCPWPIQRIFDPPDLRCRLTWQHFYFLNQLWGFVFPGTSNSFIAKRAGRLSPKNYWAAMELGTDTTGKDFNLHLKAVSLLLWREMWNQYSPTYYWKVGKLYSIPAERQPWNPFYQYLSGNHFISAQLIIAQLEQRRSIGLYLGSRTHWSFEKPTGANAHLETVFWEYIMLINYLLRDAMFYYLL